MNRTIKISVCVGIIILLVVSYFVFRGQSKVSTQVLNISERRSNKDFNQQPGYPQIALIFDDLGESLKELNSIYALDIPVTISIIPGLRFSKNIAYIAARSGFSVFIHLPMEPNKGRKYRTRKYKFISGSRRKAENTQLLKDYLNYIEIAVGVNNHMGSKATEDSGLMAMVLKVIKEEGLIFVDSRTSGDSVAYQKAGELGLICGYNEGFLDRVNRKDKIRERLYSLVDKAKNKGEIIVIAHPHEETLKVLKQELPSIKKEVDFITIEEYFGL